MHLFLFCIINLNSLVHTKLFLAFVFVSNWGTYRELDHTLVQCLILANNARTLVKLAYIPCSYCTTTVDIRLLLLLLFRLCSLFLSIVCVFSLSGQNLSDPTLPSLGFNCPAHISSFYLSKRRADIPIGFVFVV